MNCVSAQKESPFPYRSRHLWCIFDVWLAHNRFRELFWLLAEECPARCWESRHVVVMFGEPFPYSRCDTDRNRSRNPCLATSDIARAYPKLGNQYCLWLQTTKRQSLSELRWRAKAEVFDDQRSGKQIPATVKLANDYAVDPACAPAMWGVIECGYIRR